MKTGVVINLTAEQAALCDEVAERRYQRAKSRKYHSWGGGYEKGRDTQGTRGECAFAHFIGATWPQDEDDFGKSGDVNGYEVKSTMYDNGMLWVAHTDPIERKYVLCVVHENTVRIVGWLDGHGAKANASDPPPRVRPGGKPTWWVHQIHLNRIESLLPAAQEVS